MDFEKIAECGYGQAVDTCNNCGHVIKKEGEKALRCALVETTGIAFVWDLAKCKYWTKCAE